VRVFEFFKEIKMLYPFPVFQVEILHLSLINQVNESITK
jgi:hypothetical protein